MSQRRPAVSGPAAPRRWIPGAKRARAAVVPETGEGKRARLGLLRRVATLGGAWAVLAAAIGPDMTASTRRARALDTDGRSASARETLALMNTGLGLQDLTAA